ERLDALRDEVGSPRDRREVQVGRGRRQLPQEVRDVRLVTCALAAQDVRVDDDHVTEALQKTRPARRDSASPSGPVVSMSGTSGRAARGTVRFCGVKKGLR